MASYAHINTHFPKHACARGHVRGHLLPDDKADSKRIQDFLVIHDIINLHQECVDDSVISDGGLSKPSQKTHNREGNAR